ncbi:MAG: hypothetical protein ACE5HL_03200 [Terriglobia bacterium]
MARNIPLVMLVMAFLVPRLDLSAQQIVLGAGTLLPCTISEPNFSSRTAQLGDPLTCQARSIRQFGRIALPRGSYFVGRLVEYRDPGRFVGKGWIKLEFDRLILPRGDVPVETKVITVRSFKVDREGKILGRGHAKRDALGWVIPLLWPVKLITLPMRGPRPALKGEMPITLRLLDDLRVPYQQPQGRKPVTRGTPSALGPGRTTGPIWNQGPIYYGGASTPSRAPRPRLPTRPKAGTPP